MCAFAPTGPYASLTIFDLVLPSALPLLHQIFLTSLYAQFPQSLNSESAKQQQYLTLTVPCIEFNQSRVSHYITVSFMFNIAINILKPTSNSGLWRTHYFMFLAIPHVWQRPKQKMFSLHPFQHAAGQNWRNLSYWAGSSHEYALTTSSWGNLLWKACQIQEEEDL